LLREELRAGAVDGSNNQGTIKKIILLLAACLCDQQTTVACGSLEEPPFMRAFRHVLRANRIVGTQLAKIESRLN
jgi:hypothetical protein